MKYKKINNEVLVSDERLSLLDRNFIESLKKMADLSKRERVRICIHKNDREILQEMFIVHKKDAYVRPHKHLKKCETFQILEGSADILFFDEKGKIVKVLPMGDFASGKVFYYKIDKPIYHSMIIRSEYLVFHEVTKGPFNRSESVNAPWSPETDRETDVRQYLAGIERKLADNK
jgi:cupin fold WbuC family metalloprotein